VVIALQRGAITFDGLVDLVDLVVLSILSILSAASCCSSLALALAAPGDGSSSTWAYMSTYS
jgi:hypothetical protein